MVADVLKFLFILLEVILIFNLMILVHEWGHFLAARWRGLVVEKFAIWFGKPIWSKTIDGVEYRLGSIPAGGFVAIPQLAPMEMMEGEVENDRSKLPPVKPLDKIIVAFAGPLFSFMLAVLIACIVWFVGRPIGEGELSTTVGIVFPESPAEKAGIQPGDKITSIDNVPVTQFSPAGNARSSIIWNVARSESPIIPITFERDGQSHTVDVEPRAPERNGWGRANLRQIGIAPATTPRIARVRSGTPEEAAGFKRGDFIVEANGQPIKSAIQLSDLLIASAGKPIPVTVERNGENVQLELPTPVGIIEDVVKDSPAAAAGLKKGDQITAVDGAPLTELGALSKRIEETGGQPVVLTIHRGNETIERTLSPQKPEGEDKFRIGVMWTAGGIEWDLEGRMGRVHPTPVQQVKAGATTMFDTLSAVLSPKSGIGLQHLSGPVGIMHLYYTLFQREDGWLLALWFSVVLNINLAILNLLPIPVLDGGHITLAIIEGLLRRPINVRILEFVQNGCALLIIGFILYVTFYDALDLPFFRERPPAMKFEPAAENQ